MPPSPGRHVVFVASDGMLLLDLSGALAVFRAADWLGTAGTVGYTVTIAGSTRTVRAVEGVEITMDRTLDQIDACDTVIVIGTIATSNSLIDPAIVAAIQRIAAGARRVVAICWGTFLLAEAGLLDGRRATTHWAAADDLRRRYPRIRVDPDPIYVQDGHLWTSAGVTAGIDLCLALVEEDLGRKVAAMVARWLVVYLRRPGTQSQYSAALVSQNAGSEPIRAAQSWALANLREALSVDELARRAHLSVRQFSRRFRTETGLSPAAWVDGVRLEVARQLLETTDRPLKVIASECGYESNDAFGRAFRRAMGIAPGEFRDRFGASAPRSRARAAS